ncbi:MAG: response regulator [Bdellovibrionales bacterium]|nr:response regulator [Bdellovibrionales bacterium]
MVFAKLAQWWKDLSVAKKLYYLVGLMAILIATEILTLMFTVDILSAVRAFVGGEALWSKSQKNALLELQNYIIIKDEKHYDEFRKNLEVPLGDRQARLEMEKINMDRDVVTNGFLKGLNHVHDIPSMINLIRRFHNVSYLSRSIQAWREAELLLDEMIDLGEEVHRTVNDPQKKIDFKTQQRLFAKISEINNDLTIVENNFSYALGEASRWIEGTLLLCLLGLVLIVESTGLYLTFRFSRTLSETLSEINKTAKKIGAGDFSHTVPVHSGDELGQLAASFNRMTEDLRIKTGERNQAEEASQIKSLFLANMSHEIRTPIAAILGFVEILKDKNTSEEDKIKFLNTISRSGEALVTIINDILDISKVEAGKLEIDKRAFSLQALLQDLQMLLKLRSEEKGISLNFVQKGEIPDRVYSDPARLRQILLNIVGNAIKFTDRGGVTVSYSAEGDQLAFSIRDTGIGIPDAERSKLFKPFSQVDLSIRKNHGGTGLGLVLSRKLAQLLGGDVSLEESKLKGAGSTFLVKVALELPHLEDAPPSAPRSSPLSVSERDLSQFDGKAILLVEDVPDNQYIVSHFLTKVGVNVDTADNGREGVDKASQGQYDVVLMDMQMPVLDGYSATQELRQSGYSKPIIAFTAHAMKEDKQKCLDAGCNDVLTKPIKRIDLLDMVSKYI